MAIKRDANGVIDFMFDQLEEIDARTDVEFEKKIRLFDTMLKHVWNAGRMNLQFKALTLRSPDIAANTSIVLPLGNAKVIPAEPVAGE